MSIRRSVGAYFALQGLAVALWWFVLLLYPASREYFRMGDSDATLLAFWLPDLLLLATCSLLASLFSFKGSDHLLTVLYFVCGATAYAALYCVAFALLTDTAWLGVTLMVPAMILSFLCTVAVSPLHTWAFRQARPAHVKWNTTKTVAQIVVFWSSLLFIAPFVITLIEERIGLPRLSFAFQRPLATCFFLCFSVLGLWSGLTMARVGQGTPLPLDSPRRLVVSGPYAFVRNPMAIAGLGQGFSVALWCGSALVFAYVVAGVWTWQFLARPLEEDDMRRLFSRDFEEYSSHVRCWWPRRAPYRVTSALEGNAGSAILQDSAGSSSCEPGVTRRSDAALP